MKYHYNVTLVGGNAGHLTIEDKGEIRLAHFIAFDQCGVVFTDFERSYDLDTYSIAIIKELQWEVNAAFQAA